MSTSEIDMSGIDFLYDEKTLSNYSEQNKINQSQNKLLSVTDTKNENM